MTRLPNVSTILGQVRAAVSQSQLTKEAAAPEPEYTMPIAQSLQSLAGNLKVANFDDVTYEEVISFGQQLLGR